MLSIIDTFSKHFFNKYFQMEKVIPYCQLSDKILYTLSKISQIDFYLGSFQSSADLLITNMFSSLYVRDSHKGTSTKYIVNKPNTSRTVTLINIKFYSYLKTFVNLVNNLSNVSSAVTCL